MIGGFYLGGQMLGGSGFSETAPPTPALRIYAIARDSRIVSIPEDPRIMPVPEQERILETVLG